MNDVILFDIEKMKVHDQLLFSEASLVRRMYHCGFKIDNSIFSIGGFSNNGKLLDEFVEINLMSRKQSEAVCTDSELL